MTVRDCNVASDNNMQGGGGRGEQGGGGGAGVNMCIYLSLILLLFLVLLFFKLLFYFLFHLWLARRVVFLSILLLVYKSCYCFILLNLIRFRKLCCSLYCTVVRR